MALTDKQVNGVIKLFAAAFVSCNEESERKKKLIQFEDIFGKGIADWKIKCRNAIGEETSATEILDAYDQYFANKEKDTSEPYQIRLINESDLPQVIDLINTAFVMALGISKEDQKMLNKFIQSGYSVVAVCKEEIIGVALAYEVPDLTKYTLYLDTFVVAEAMRGNGIGKKMLDYIMSLFRTPDKCRVSKIMLQTDKSIEAYQIYKHWGFMDDDLIHMHMYFI